MAVVAVESFEYQGQAVKPGDVCLVRPIEAASLSYRKQARFPSDDEARGVYDRRDLEAVTPPKRAPRKRTSSKQTYRRRDLVAE